MDGAPDLLWLVLGRADNSKNNGNGKNNGKGGWGGGLLGIGGEVFGWAAPVALAEADAGVGVVGNPDVDGVHSGGGIAAALGLGLEAEQVVVVDVVGELVEAVVEALLGGEVDVLASGERGQLVGGVLLEGVHRHDQ